MTLAQAPPEVSRLAAEVAGIVREVVGPTTVVLWYGSWVRGTAVPRSDVDLAIVGERTVLPIEMARLRERIDELPTLRKIDLVDAHAVGDTMNARILSEGVAL